MKIISERTLEWFRNEPCEMCGAPPPSDPHHIYGRGHGGGNRLDVPWNLISLCRRCHQNVQNVRAYIPKLCEMVVQRENWRLQRCKKEFAEKFERALDLWNECR